MISDFVKIGLRLKICVAALAALAVGLSPAAAGKQEKAERLVNEAADTVSYFAADSAFEPLWDLADDAKAMVIIPSSIRAGFIIGGQAGDAVMVARKRDGTWSQPTFLTIGSLSVGLQAGGEESESILLVMTQRGMEHLLSTSVKLGADVSLAAGPIGAGAKAATTDILAFERSRGLYGGISVEGAILKARHKLNTAYYQKDLAAGEIIYRDDAYNPASAKLQNAVWRLANRDAPANLAPAVRGADGYYAPQPGDGAPINSEVAPGQRIDPYGAPPAAGAPDLKGVPEEDIDYEDDAVWGAPIGDPQ